MKNIKEVKKLSALILATAIAVASIGCGNSSNTEGNASEEPVVETPDPATRAESEVNTGLGSKDSEEIDLNVMVWDRGNAAPGTTTEDNALTNWIKEQVKEQLNINVSYTAVPRSGSDDKLNVMISGGTAPDIVFTYDQSLFYNYAQSGGLYDLTEIYEQYGSDIERFCGAAQSVSVIDGSRFAVMKQRGTEDPRHVAYIRKDWLGELNMEMPTTKEELGEYLYAVKENKLAGDKTIPWAMSGRSDTEKMYQNFITSYIELPDERTAYIYSEAYVAIAPGAEEGLKQLNTWYNDGLITQDFPTDTSEDMFLSDISNGYVGFILDDQDHAWDSFKVLNMNLGHETFVPIQCFDREDGSYITPHEPRHGMYVMIPANTSEEKAIAAMKYLNWMADPEVSVKLVYTPDLTYNDLGVAVEPTEAEKNEAGYPGSCGDLNIVNDNFAWANDLDVVAEDKYLNQEYEWASLDWYKDYYETRSIGKFRFPVYAYISEDEQRYGADVKNRMIQHVYRTICCTPEQFDEVYESSYNELINAGLQKILDGRADYYDSVVKQ